LILKAEVRQIADAPENRPSAMKQDAGRPKDVDGMIAFASAIHGNRTLIREGYAGYGAFARNKDPL